MPADVQETFNEAQHIRLYSIGLDFLPDRAVKAKDAILTLKHLVENCELNLTYLLCKVTIGLRALIRIFW